MMKSHGMTRPSCGVLSKSLDKNNAFDQNQVLFGGKRGWFSWFPLLCSLCHGTIWESSRGCGWWRCLDASGGAAWPPLSWAPARGAAAAAGQHNEDEAKAPAVEGCVRGKNERRNTLETHEIKGGRNYFEYDLSVHYITGTQVEWCKPLRAEELRIRIKYA